MKKQHTQKGYALVMSLILAGLFLLITVGISNVAYRGAIFATQANASVEAFYMADVIMECVLYYDTHENKFATSTTANEVVMCGPETTTVTNTDRVIDLNTGFGTTTYRYNYGSSDTDACGFALIGKHYESDIIHTTIEVRGYNTCSLTNPGRVERGVRAFIR